MTIDMIHQPSLMPQAETKPNLTLITGEAMPHPESRDLFTDYFALRIAAGMAEKPEGEELTGVQESVRNWLSVSHPDMNEPGTVEDYRGYGIDIVNRKIGGLVDFLRTNHADQISEVELDATDAFIKSTFAMYEDKERTEELTDKDGSFAFLVPARMSRKYPEYGQEVEPVIPALRYVPNELRAWIMRECPPFVIDMYKPDETGRRGYLVYVPITEDMQDDLGAESAGTFVHAARDAVNDAADFARDRLGVRVAGLGATLPRITDHGRTIERNDIITTTGHGGTAWLIYETIRSLTGDKMKRPGVIGLGYIGAAAAGIAAETCGERINIFDTRRSAATKLEAAYPDRFNVADDAEQLIIESDVIISAVTRPIDLEKLGINDMEGKLVVDDSQPASFSPEQVESRGGSVVWVIGRDQSGRIVRTGYDYGTMANGQADLFGCEAEAATLEFHWQRLESLGVTPENARRIIGNIALRGPVDVESANRIGKLFTLYGVTTSTPQAFGKHVQLSPSI